MSKWTTDKTVSFNVEDDDFEADVSIKFVRSMYGEDADGNRGEMRTELDDYEITEVRDGNGKVVELTDKLEDLISEAVDNIDDYEEPEPDCDDQGEDE